MAPTRGPAPQCVTMSRRVHLPLTLLVSRTSTVGLNVVVLGLRRLRRPRRHLTIHTGYRRHHRPTRAKTPRETHEHRDLARERTTDGAHRWTSTPRVGRGSS